MFVILLADQESRLSIQKPTLATSTLFCTSIPYEENGRFVYIRSKDQAYAEGKSRIN